MILFQSIIALVFCIPFSAAHAFQYTCTPKGNELDHYVVIEPRSKSFADFIPRTTLKYPDYESQQRALAACWKRTDELNCALTDLESYGESVWEIKDGTTHYTFANGPFSHFISTPSGRCGSKIISLVKKVITPRSFQVFYNDEELGASTMGYISIESGKAKLYNWGLARQTFENLVVTERGNEIRISLGPDAVIILTFQGEGRYKYDFNQYRPKRTDFAVLNNRLRH